MKGIIIASLVIIIIIFLFILLLKESNKTIDYNNSKIDEIKEEINKISTIEECEELKQRIKEYYKNTDVLFKNIKQEYSNMFYIVVGIEMAIKKLIKR